MKLALTGTIGRGEDFARLGSDSFDRMYEMALRVLALHVRRPDKIEVVGGGAPWAEHVAVRLFRGGEAGGLTLILPCDFDQERERFCETDQYADESCNPGTLLNLYHRKFEAKTFRPGLAELGDAIDRGARVRIENGSAARHRAISDLADIVIAFAFTGGAAKAAGCSQALQCDLYGGACSRRGAEGRCFHVDVSTWTLIGPFCQPALRMVA